MRLMEGAENFDIEFGCSCLGRVSKEGVRKPCLSHALFEEYIQ